ncbi:MAG: hypothetical protein L0G36_09860 [Brevibacterium sp.]|nr:hypothetical protein [Brevibacterium sp.]
MSESEEDPSDDPLLLVLPTLGSLGADGSSYGGEHFICFPAVGPTTGYPVNIWEEHRTDPSDVAVGAEQKARLTRSEAESTFEVAVCGEQRSRRVAWALILAVPVLLAGLSARAKR